MNRSSLLFVAFSVLCAASLAASAKPGAPSAITRLPRPIEAYSTDFVRNSKIHPRRLADTAAPGGIEQIGEIVVLEGDADLVVDDGAGGFAVADQTAITRRFLTKYPDVFDEVFMFTTFTDTGAGEGTLAYEISVRQNVQGIGREVFDQRRAWGSSSIGKLYAFVNMMRWDQFDGWRGSKITDTQNPIYSTMGQEFAHGWLSFMHYKEAGGEISAAMLGRDASHWASTLSAQGSVMDGSELTPQMDGSFQVTASNVRYSELDLYGMGLIPASEVAPWFLVKNAKRTNGSNIDPRVQLNNNARFTGTREDITIEQVIEAEGARVPDASMAQKSFRIAFILVTRPGEHATDVVDIAYKLEAVRSIWEKKFTQYTRGRGVMCTQASAPCGAPEARISAGSITEATGNGNDVIEPGETVWVKFALDNDADRDARSVQVSTIGNGVSTPERASEISLLKAGASTEVVFLSSVPTDVVCGQSISVRAESLVNGNTFRGFASAVTGLTTALTEHFEINQGTFEVNRDDKDSASFNGWEYGTPVGYGGRGWTYQPSSGFDGSKGAWFTGLQEGNQPNNDSGLGVGTSSLWSVPIDVSRLYKPHLKFMGWFQGLDPANEETGVGEGSKLVTEVSADEGKTWVLLDEMIGANTRWRTRDLELDGKVDLSGNLIVRFTAVNPSETFLVEAGIDDLEITTLSEACNPNLVVPVETPPVPTSDCAYAQHARGGLGALALFVFMTLFATRRIARRRQRA